MLTNTNYPPTQQAPATNTLWTADNFLWQLLISLMDSSDFKIIFQIFNYFIDRLLLYFRTSLFLRYWKENQGQDLSKQRISEREIATQTLDRPFGGYRFQNLSMQSIHPKLLQLMLSIAKSITPVVIILSPGSNPLESSTVTGVRMSCPPLEMIIKYAGALASTIEVRQYASFYWNFLIFLFSNQFLFFFWLFLFLYFLLRVF